MVITPLPRLRHAQHALAEVTVAAMMGTARHTHRHTVVVVAAATAVVAAVAAAV